jgi:aminoglycoside phosphotransferase family enzyme
VEYEEDGAEQGPNEDVVGKIVEAVIEMARMRQKQTTARLCS